MTKLLVLWSEGKKKKLNRLKTTWEKLTPSVEMKNTWCIRSTLIAIISLTKERMRVYTLGRVGRGREGNVCVRNGWCKMCVRLACASWVYEEAHCRRAGERHTEALRRLAQHESHENPGKPTHMAHVLLGSPTACWGNWPALSPHTKHFRVKAELLALKYRPQIF